MINPHPPLLHIGVILGRFNIRGVGGVIIRGRDHSVELLFRIGVLLFPFLAGLWATLIGPFS